MQECLGLSIKTKLSCFIINHEKVNYIVSVHHGLPFNEYTYINNLLQITNQEIKIHKQPIWNELIIFNTENTIIDESNIFKKLRIKLPSINERVYLNSNVSLSIATMQSINLHHLPTNPSVIYIYAHVISGTIIKSMSGSAIYDNTNRLVGILSKTHELNGQTFAVIIPAYYLYKTLIKVNNNAIYNLNNNNAEITKINNFNVKNNMVFHSSLSINMKLDCFYMLEGDDNYQININNGTLVNFRDIKSELYINNNHCIEKLDDNYLINISLLKYIDMCFGEISPHIFNFIKNNFKNRMYCSYEKQDMCETVHLNSRKIEYIDSETNILDISNIKLGKHLYTLKFKS
jgi:hypothetical protein